MQIYPGILTDSLESLVAQVERLKSVRDLVQVLQIDIIDGEFTDNLTLFPNDLWQVDFGNFQLDFHLMMVDPVTYLGDISQLENVRAVLGQVERMHSQKEFIEICHELKMKAGLSLDGYTPIEAIDNEIWPQLDFIQVMGVQTGFQGQKFFGAQIINKIKQIDGLKQARKLPQLEIIVDGGMNKETIPSCFQAGARGFEVGKLIKEAEDLRQVIQKLKSLVVI